MKCPSCKSELVITGQEALETLEEHIFNPNGEPCDKDKYECLNKECLTFGKMCWNENGDCYRKRCDMSIFIDKNDAPFGSIARKINVEIYKKDENRELFKIGKFFFHLKWRYKSNQDGEILKRRPYIETWIKNKDGNYNLYVSGIKSLWLSIRVFHRARSLKGPFNLKEILDKDHYYNKGEWWRVLSCFYARTFTKVFGQVKGI